LFDGLSLLSRVEKSLELFMEFGGMSLELRVAPLVNRGLIERPVDLLGDTRVLDHLHAGEVGIGDHVKVN
jgi:hypothetical protein